MAKFEMELAIGEKKRINESDDLNEKVLKKDKDKESAAKGGADVYVDGNDVDFVEAFQYKEWNKKEKDLDPTNANKYKASSNDIVFAVSNIDNGDVTFYPGNALEVVESKKVKSTFEENATKLLKDINEEEEPKKAAFEEVADKFLKTLNEDDDEKVEEKLNKKTLQVEADGEDIDDMIDDLVDGDEDETQGPDDDAPDDSPEEKIKDGESPADAVEGDEDDNASPSDKLQNAAKELAKDSKKLEKIKKLLGEANELIEADTIELDDDGEEVEDAENMEVADNGDEVEVMKMKKGPKLTKESDEWSDDVKTKWTPPAGLFTEPATKIATVLADASKDLDQAMSRIDFYINRAGKLLKPKDKQNLEAVKPLLRKKFA